MRTNGIIFRFIKQLADTPIRINCRYIILFTSFRNDGLPKECEIVDPYCGPGNPISSLENQNKSPRE